MRVIAWCLSPIFRWLELLDDKYEFGVIPDDWDALAED